MSHDGFDPHAFDVRHLTPQQWTMLRKCIMARAQEEQQLAIRQIGAGVRALVLRVWRLARRVTEALRTSWCRHLARRKRAMELRELSAMNDIALRDIGISRPDVRAAMRARARRLAPRHLVPRHLMPKR